MCHPGMDKVSITGTCTSERSISSITTKGKFKIFSRYCSLLGYTLEIPGFESLKGHGLSCISKRALGPTQHPIGWIPVLFLWGKVIYQSGLRLTTGCHNAEVKNKWSCNSVHPIRLHGMCRGNFTCTSCFTRTCDTACCRPLPERSGLSLLSFVSTVTCLEAFI